MSTSVTPGKAQVSFHTTADGYSVRFYTLGPEKTVFNLPDGGCVSVWMEAASAIPSMGHSSFFSPPARSTHVPVTSTAASNADRSLRPIDPTPSMVARPAPASQPPSNFSQMNEASKPANSASSVPATSKPATAPASSTTVTAPTAPATTAHQATSTSPILAYTGQSLPDWSLAPSGDKSKTFDQGKCERRLKGQTAFEDCLRKIYERPDRKLQDRQRTRIATWMQDRLDLCSESSQHVQKDAYNSLKMDSTWQADSLMSFPASTSFNSSVPPTSTSSSNSRDVKFADTASAASSGSSKSTGPGGMSLSEFTSRKSTNDEERVKKQEVLRKWARESKENMEEYNRFAASRSSGKV